MTTASTVASAVSAERLWSDLRELAQLGARADGGVGRLTLDSNDIAARQWLVKQARALGASAHIDHAGNLFLRFEGTDPDASPVVTGSHIDSQPAGGAYDGAYGVLAGLAVLRAFHETDARPRRPIEVVAWTNEEGVRFAPGCSGSSCFTGKATLDDTRALTDNEGISFGEAVDQCLTTLLTSDRVEKRALGTPIHQFIELHIEQGPILERAGLPIGIVEGIQGVAWFEVRVEGTANHAGTTPRSARADALEAACELAQVLREIARDEADVTRFTIGRWSVEPDSINTIPDAVTFSIDLRHPETGELDRLEQAFTAAVSQPWAGCSAQIKGLSRIDPVDFPQDLVQQLAVSVDSLGLKAMRMTSGAFHDAIHLAAHCPTAMLFIPCEAGVSHHPSESITPEQAVQGARALAGVMFELANT